jgi:hypothetical protein
MEWRGALSKLFSGNRSTLQAAAAFREEWQPSFSCRKPICGTGNAICGQAVSPQPKQAVARSSDLSEQTRNGIGLAMFQPPSGTSVHSPFSRFPQAYSGQKRIAGHASRTIEIDHSSITSFARARLNRVPMIASDQEAGKARDRALRRHHGSSRLRSNVRRTEAPSHLRVQLSHALQEVWLRLPLPMAKIDLDRARASTMDARLTTDMAQAWYQLEIQPRRTKTGAPTTRATGNVTGFASRGMDNDWSAECLPPSPNPIRRKARARRLGRATHYIRRGILAAIHCRGLEQEMPTPLAGGRCGIFE